jgi:choline dehydrogenase-like flavoprotein/pimeloyl-ACP methyl ester carboxylesterase
VAVGEQAIGSSSVPQATAWLSHGFEELLSRLEKQPDYDVVIVGSGYGGAVAAAELAGCKDGERPISVCLLERGNEYLPGMFPARLADLPGHVRFSTAGSARPRGRREGLFDVRIGPDINAIVGNGLGGGSLINAGVMETPHDDVFKDWPGTVRQDLKDHFFSDAKTLLGATDGHTIGRHPQGVPAKFEALKSLASGVRDARGEFREASITVAMEDERNDDHVALNRCKRCGDCTTGCNHGAKISLDVNLLVRAWRAKAEIFTGATVLRIERDRDGIWLLYTVHTDEQLRKRQRRPVKLRARKVILAAGTFGSTEILLRSQSEALRFSPRLGQRFSSNGDAIAVLYDQNIPVNAVADESVSPDDRAVGPTITGILDLRAPNGEGHVIEELAIPGPLRRVFEETVTTAKTLHELGDPDDSDHRSDEPQHDPCAVQAAAIMKTSVFVIMGDDGAGGALELAGGDDEDEGDGAISVRWPRLRDHPLFRSQLEKLQKLACGSGTKGRVLPNPLWQLLPDSMQFLFDNRRGPLLTVHPLGGCPMGSNADDGVVNHLGQVFDVTSHPHGTKPYGDLVVLDGSIVRNCLGINPALTITALALRAVRELRKEWRFVEQDEAQRDRSPLERPRFREAPEPEKPRRTEFKLVERITGEAMLKAKGGGRIACVVELTLRFKKHAIADLVLPVNGKPVPMARTLEVDEGEVRVFQKEAWDGWRRRGDQEKGLADIVEVRAPLIGNLKLLQREGSMHKQRRCRALRAWFCNRGLRDSWQGLVQRWKDGGLFRGSNQAGAHPDPKAGTLWADVCERARSAKALASRGGEVRQLKYELRLADGGTCNPKTPIETASFVAGQQIAGLKRLTYERRSNPWRQLMQMQLLAFPGLGQGTPVLELDAKFLAAEGVPLMKIVAQNDQVSALADLVSLLAYFLRLLLNIHVWSFRRPDAPVAREPQRLPAMIKGRLPEPRIREIDLDRLPNGTPVRVRLTRYRPRSARGRPVVMIHGYSASGTTFAHHAVNPNMAEYFYDRKRDVWVLDLRTSSGMPTARHPWKFEDAALADLPAAFDAICRETGSNSVDVFAHCMGAAMFSMAVLAPPESGDRYFRERLTLPGRIHKAVLSQIAPVVVMSPANVFRAYAMSYLRHFLPFANYEFRVRPDAGLMDQLIDRLLATLPYPEEEFDIENPPWPWRCTPFVGTRHRMDALYGRDFSLADKQGSALLDDKVLEYIDDLFGPLSIDTVSQAIHFARSQVVTNAAGRNEYVLPSNLFRRWTFPTLSIHGAENGLSDVATLERFKKKFMEDADIDITVKEFRGFGHQDCLIGKNAEQVFKEVFEFLE